MTTWKDSKMKKNETVYFIGIKGTGMASMARICHQLGYDVLGSDIDRHFFTEDALREINIPILSFNKDNIKDGMTVIIGNAFGDDHEEVVAAHENPTVETYRYHEYLGKLMEGYRSIAVSGSHGKTTTTTLLRDMLSESKDVGYLIGDGRGELIPNDEYFAVEACEFRRHFLAYKPKVAIMTNFEIDHVDYFKDVRDYLSAYEAFADNVEELLVIWGDDPHYKELNLNHKIWTYGFNEGNNFIATNMEKLTDRTRFDVIQDGVNIGRFDLPIVGDHMVLDALSVIAVGVYENIDVAMIEKGLQSFKGAKRRYVVDEDATNVYIDDYAHHPTEVRVTLEATRTRYPNRKIVAIFKPHRVGRVHYFVDEFASALSIADEVYLCPFTSIDDQEEGIDIDITYLQDRIPNSKIVELNDHDLDLLASHAPAVYVFMSSKDIYDLKDALKMRFNS